MDYRIAAKVIENRIKAVLPKLINNIQAAFMKGRFIGENIRLIDCMVLYMLHGIIHQVYYFSDISKKAFDSLEWPFNLDTSRFLGGFGTSIINWVRIFNWRIDSCLLDGRLNNFSSREEVSGKPATFRHIVSFWRQRYWPRQSEAIGT